MIKTLLRKAVLGAASSSLWVSAALLWIMPPTRAIRSMPQAARLLPFLHRPGCMTMFSERTTSAGLKPNCGLEAFTGARSMASWVRRRNGPSRGSKSVTV